MIPKSRFFTYASDNFSECYQENFSQWQEMYTDWEIFFNTDILLAVLD